MGKPLEAHGDNPKVASEEQSCCGSTIQCSRRPKSTSSRKLLP